MFYRWISIIFISAVLMISSIDTSKSEGSDKSSATAFSSKLRSNHGVDLLPNYWPSLPDMKKGYEKSKLFPFVKNDRRGHDDFFYQYFLREYQDDFTKFEDFEYLWVDLNSDDQAEVIVRMASSGYCGSVGCSGSVFQRIENQWKQIGWGSIMEGVSVGPPIRNGYLTAQFGDMCIVWNQEKGRYDLEDDDRQDGDHVHSHACGKNYDPNTADATYRCLDCHL